MSMAETSGSEPVGIGLGLQATVLICGASTLAVEVCSARTLAPAFGSSIYIWGAVLSLTLIFLALGYEWGGRLGDRLEDPFGRLVLHVMISAFWLGALPLWDAGLLELALATGPFLGPMVAAFGILAVPITLQATVVPLAFRAGLPSVRSHPGALMGRLFAVSTLGSVLGALAAAYLFVPWVGVRRSYLLAAGFLLVAALPRLWKGRRRELDVAVILLFLLWAGRLVPQDWLPRAELKDGVRFLHREASRYGQLDVVQDDRDGSRMLALNGAVQNWAVGPRFSRSKAGYGQVGLRVLDRFPRGETALVLGLGAGTVARMLERAGYEVTAVEIDPAIVKVAREWFAFPEDRIEVHVMDGRSFLRQAGEVGRKWDVVLFDVFSGGTPPEHLYTLEAFREVREVLTPKGVLLCNIPSFVGRSRLQTFDPIAHTLARVFPYLEGVNVLPFNSGTDDVSLVLLVASSLQPHPVALPPRMVPVSFSEDWPVLTDDRNPLTRWSVRVSMADKKLARGWLGDGILSPH